MKDRRMVILRAAEELLHRQGMQRTTVQEIAQQASVGVGTVYLEFENKDAIIAAISGEKYDQILRAMRRAALRSGTYGERLEGMLRARSRSFMELASCGSHAIDLVHCERCEAVEQAKERFYLRQYELLTDFIQQAQDDGAFRLDIDAERLSATILRACAILTPPHLLCTPAEHREQFLEDVQQILLFGIVARS